MIRRIGSLFCAVSLTACVAAQQARTATAGQAPSQGRQGGADLDAGTMFRLSRQMDSDGDTLVQEKEFSTGFAQLEKGAAKVSQDLTAWLDTDKNGKLSPEEMRPFYAAMSLLQFIRAIDQNGDTVLQDEELDTAFTRLAEFCQTTNDQVMTQFDLDGDGKLNAEEQRVARAGLQQLVMQRAPREAGARGGGGRARQGVAARRSQP